MKIYLGQVNISSIFEHLRVGFEALGHEVYTVSESDANIVSKTDFSIAKELARKMHDFTARNPDILKNAEQYHEIWQANYDRLIHESFIKAAEADICIFMWNSFLPMWQDIPLLQKNGCKVAVIFCGSESRVESIENYYRKMLVGCNVPCDNTPLYDAGNALHFIRSAEAHADAILAGCPSSLRPFYFPIFPLYDLQTTPFHINKDRTIPVVLHSASNQQAKGTAIWKKIFDDLHAEGLKFTVRMLENVPHNEFLKLLQYVDIVCDGLVQGGKLMYEAMAGGCAVMSAIGTDMIGLARKDDEALRHIYHVQKGSPEDDAIMAQHMKKYWMYYPDVNPCIPVTPETAKDALRSLLQNKEKRVELAIRGRKMLEKYASPAVIAADILQCIQEPDSFATQTLLAWHHSVLYYDYVPSSNKEAAMINRTTDIVRDCAWYKRSCKPMQRDGLVF